MAIKPFCHFSLDLVGDGISTSIAVNVVTAPFILASANGGTFSPTFTLSTLMPTGTDNVTSSNGIATTATIGLLGAITFNFATAPSLSHFSVEGYFEF